MFLKLADYTFQIINKYEYIKELAKDYITDDNCTDIKIEITDSDIELERRLAEGIFSDSYLESVATYRKIAETLPLMESFVLHSAVFDVDGTGVAFAAHSGTGKTTHMLLWQRLLGDRFKIVNGDKPIIRFFESEPNTPYAYGNPWNGKENLGSNTKTPLRHICFIERAEKNSCEKMSSAEVVDKLFNQIYMPKNSIALTNTIGLINRLINSCCLWKIKCNMDSDAAAVAYNKIFKSL